MTEEEKIFRSIDRWVKSRKNKQRAVYFHGFAELIVNHKGDIEPMYSAPLGSFTVDKYGIMHMKEGAEKNKTNHSRLVIEKPTLVEQAVIKACMENPYSVQSDGHTGVPIYTTEVLFSETAEIEKEIVSINNRLFNELCGECGIDFRLEVIEEHIIAF